ncbi:sn-1-specific diacylglycerol lipase ABHD11 isoform X1 [Denticeps clupeoides]|uniref:sn-1-specific diacylglycerol lipase ABHD11 isoform X1 n=1 Tax=Denticeps clupeoides TaxID=299321 RepID=UPI0010A2C29C|nr:protein ABHD11 isoform X1 [Denticeps clupeoides]
MSAVCRLWSRRAAPVSVAGARSFCLGLVRMNRASNDRSATGGSASPVNLTYDVFDGKGEKTPLVFLHGLFGCKSNFHSIAKSLVQRTGRKVLTVDARNHGNSPHSPILTYEAMTNDLQHLLSQLRIGKCVLIGHSMGGKVAMTTALLQPNIVERLVVVDISPAHTSVHTNFHTYIRALKEVKVTGNLPRSTARRLAEDQLRKHIKEHTVRQFLLTNLVEQNGDYAWRVNLEAISNHMEDILNFPEFNQCYNGPTLFLGGNNSDYITSEDYPEIQRLFPNADIQYIPDASHWIHADKPLDFISSIITFLQS